MNRSQTPYDRISRSLPTLRALSIIWIVAYHLMGNTQGYLDVDEAIATLSQGGLKTILNTGLELFISAGATGVNVFLIISGFGLTASWWHKYGQYGVVTMPLTTFLKKRVLRIFPPFWAAVAIATLLYFLNSAWAPFGQDLWQAGGLAPIWALLTTTLTLRNFVPEHYYFLNGAWWYVGLCLQLYLIFPVLIRLGSRWGWDKLLMAAFLFSIAYRAAVLLSPLPTTESILSIIPLAFFPSRLFEFVFGMYIAITFLKAASTPASDEHEHRWLKALLLKPQLAPASFSLFFVGLSFKWFPYPVLTIFSEALIGVGLFCGLVSLCQIKTLLPAKLSQLQLSQSVGKYSYGIYLTHMNIYLVLWPMATQWVPSYWPRFVLVLIACVLIGMGFDAGFARCSRAISTSLRQKKTA